MLFVGVQIRGQPVSDTGLACNALAQASWTIPATADSWRSWSARVSRREAVMGSSRIARAHKSVADRHSDIEPDSPAAIRA
jgi:hypothetical protein